VMAPDGIMREPWPGFEHHATSYASLPPIVSLGLGELHRQKSDRLFKNMV